MTMFDDPTPPPRPPRESDSGVDSGAIRAAIESWPIFRVRFSARFSVFAAFAYGHRTCTALRANGPACTRFFRDGGSRLPDSVSRAGRSNSGGGETGSRRGNSRAQGLPRAGRQSGHGCPPRFENLFFGSSKNLFFGAVGTVAPGNKKTRDCGDSAGRAASGRTARGWVNMQNQRHAVNA
jgi:hypothetical protein